MTTALFIFNIVQLLMISAVFYYVLFFKDKKRITRNSKKSDDDEGGLLINNWPDVVLPPIDGIEYPSEKERAKITN